MAGRESSPAVLAILPRGEAIRNFVYTGCLDLVAQQATLCLLSVIPSEQIDKLLQKRYQQVMPLIEVQERRTVRTLRELLDIAHARWLWSQAAQERWRLRDQEANTPTRALKRVTKKALAYPFATRQGLAALSRLERAASWWLRPTDTYLSLFERLRPRLVFNASQVHGGTTAVQPVQAAQRLGIPTAGFVFSWDNLTSQGRIVPPYDYYLVWNERLRDQLLSMYDSLRPDQVVVTGTPQFDFHFREDFYWSRENFCSRVGADPTRPIVLYTTGMSNHMPGEPRIVEGIAGMLEDMEGSPQLLVRVYPKDRTDRFEELKKRRPEILFPQIPWEAAYLTPRPEDGYLLTNMLRHAAIGINVASTISLELCMFDKPVINVGYNPPGMPRPPVDFWRYYEFDHYQEVVRRGAVAVAKSESEMRGLIHSALCDPGALAKQRRALLEWMFGTTLDGRCASRVAEALLSLADAEHVSRSPT